MPTFEAYQALRRRDRPAARRDARRARASRPTIPLSRREAATERTMQRWISGASGSSTRRSTPAARSTNWPDEQTQRWSQRLMRTARRLLRGAAPAPSRRRRAADPHPWRFPSRPGAGRRRATPTSSTSKANRRGRSRERRAKAQPAARRGRPAALVRLRGRATRRARRSTVGVRRAADRRARAARSVPRRRAATPSSRPIATCARAQLAWCRARRAGRCSTSS